MPANKVKVIPKVIAAAKGVTRIGRRHIAASAEPKNVEQKIIKDSNSPNSNSENISPISKKRRRERDGVVEKEQLASPGTPNAISGRNGLRNSKLDKSYDSESSFEKHVTKRISNVESAKNAVGLEEANSSGNKADLNKVLDESLATPKSSLLAENTGIKKSDRQLRSSGKKVRSIFDSPVKEIKSPASVGLCNSEESDISSSLTAAKKVEVDAVSQKDSVDFAKAATERKEEELENSNESSHISEIVFENSTENYTTLSQPKEAEQKLIDQKQLTVSDIEVIEEQPTVSDIEVIEVKEENSPNTNDNASLISIDNIQSQRKEAEQKLIDQKRPTVSDIEVIEEQPTVSDIEVIEVKQENSTKTNENASVISIDNIQSPSQASVDSAKGSSIGTEADYSMLFTGDLYWGQIHHFCYWPCMVCPDDTEVGNPITRMIEQQMEVHVRFFADNARHSWVKRENLLRYLGLKQYKELTNEVKAKFGESSPKCKIFFPKRSKKNVWRGAVKEADDMVNVPYEARLETFFKLNDIARERIKEEKLRRKSINLAKSNQNLSLISSMDTSDSSDIVKKRNRSESPPSPEFSPERSETKRRKTTTAVDRNDYMLSRTNDSENIEQSPVSSLQQQQQQNVVFSSPEIETLYDILKEYITSGFQCDPIIEAGIYRSARNVWAMKKLVDGKIAESGGALALTPNNSNENKRISLRLKDLQQRQHMQAIIGASPSPAKSPLQVTHPVPVKRRSSVGSKSKNRPMPEVIDDIFNLDRFYLFDYTGGRAPVCKYCNKPDGVIKRCSKGCLSWLHVDCSAVVEAQVSAPDNDNNLAEKPETFGKKQHADDKRMNSVKSENLMSITHVTADDESTENEEIQQNSALKAENYDSPKDVDVEVETTVLLETEEEAEPLICKECANDLKPQCFVCKSEKVLSQTATTTATLDETTNDGNSVEKEALHMCNMPNCGRAYHMTCLKYWPQAKTVHGKNSAVSLRCPSHSCHTCVSDDPKGKYQNLKDANTTKCVKCPATYHMDSTCIPAGSQVLTAAHIICPRHGLSNTDQNVNVSWCFICVRGGKLLCCETCPTAVHAECTNAQLEPNENYICDECESGRLPLYGEMVWAKFTVYRWWPAIILPPTEVPLNIRNKAHNPFDFVIRFFGTHDHGWISRRRVYLYVEGDWSEPPKSKRLIDQSYLRGVIEAREAYEIIKAKTLKRDTENSNKERLHPHPYVKIRVNRAVPPVKLHQDIEMASKCGCDPNSENPCGLDSNCLNRVLYHECNPKVCPAGERCQNQMFESRISPPLEVFYAKKERGFGLRCREAIPSGAFIIEYVGEVINSEEFQRRMGQKSTDRDENYYFLYVEKDYIIDAGPKGNMARFMNHSCNPNCETQKWSVNGLNRIGLFAIKDIPAKTELTFNYHWDELLGNDKKMCCCGNENCTGQIGKISKEEIKRKQEIEAANLSANVQRLKTAKLSKRRSSSLRIKTNKNDLQMSLNKQKQKVLTKEKKRVAVSASPNESEKSVEQNDNNNNV